MKKVAVFIVVLVSLSLTGCVRDYGNYNSYGHGSYNGYGGYNSYGGYGGHNSYGGYYGGGHGSNVYQDFNRGRDRVLHDYEEGRSGGH